MKQTLVHEMCHVAAWLIDGILAPAHGNHFWKWAGRVEKAIPGIKVTQCHSYEINVPFKFICTNDGCQHVYSRHSRKGIDINK
jgi:predicted SprT family Zn-dependent metalloprotease